MPISTQKAAQPDAEAEALDPGQSGVEQQEEAGLTLDDYARAKALPVDFLKSLGVSQSTFGRTPAVRIPYFGTAGEELAVRFRIGLRATASAGKPGPNCAFMAKTSSPKPTRLGTWCWSKGNRTATPSGTMAFLRSGFLAPAIGAKTATPVTSMESRRSMSSSSRTAAARPCANGLAQSKIRDRVKLIHLPTKDPSALYLEDRHQFPQRWKAACQQAIPWIDLEVEANAEGRSEKPRLLVEPCDPDRTVSALRDIIAKSGTLYDRGVPVRLAHDKTLRGTVAHPMTPDALVLMAHRICRPRIVKKGEEVDARLPRNVAVMYLDWRGEWQLPPLNGIASAPMLREDGTIGSAQGYDITTGMWLENVPDMAFLVPERPTEEDARSALHYIRETFKTFCFADAETMLDPNSGAAVVNTAKPPGKDESAFLTALLTAVCRPSLYLAPGLLLRGAPISGAGAGKGLLARCICIIAFGREPHAVTGGVTPEELEKRIAAELIEGSPALFLDNMNNVTLRSDILASAITERPARVRLLGKSQMVPLNASAMVILTGNGLTVSEDLARRFIAVDLDPGTEDPEARRFTTDIRVEVTKNRDELLAAALTIWRWGRIGRIFRLVSPWVASSNGVRWVRDPLLALGCKDPAERVGEAKERDGRRQVITDLFLMWWTKHGSKPMPAADLHEDVKSIIDPQRRGRQFQASYLAKLVNTRIAGFILTRQAAAGRWGVATYALEEVEADETHRGHRGHRPEESYLDPTSSGTDGHPDCSSSSDAPYAPYAIANC